MSRQIHILKNGTLEETLDLENGTYSLGRTADADIVLADSAVSKSHASLTIDKDGIIVKDSGSANGIFFQGNKITEKRFDNNFEINIKPFTIRATVGDMHESDETVAQKMHAIRHFSINNIKISLFLIFSIIILLTVLIGYFPLKQKTASIARQEKLKTGILLARYLAEMNRPFLVEEQHSLIRLSPVRMEDGVIYAFVVDGHGRIIAPREKQGDYVDWSGLSGAFAEAKLRLEDGKQDEKIIFYPIIEQNQTLGAAIIGFAWQQTGADAASGMGFLAVALIVILFGVGFAMAYLLARAFLNPLKSLYEAVEIAIKNGATSITYQAPYAELENLKRAFDRLLARKSHPSSPGVSSADRQTASPRAGDPVSESRDQQWPPMENSPAVVPSASSDASLRDLEAPWCVIDRENYTLVRFSDNFASGLGTKDCRPGIHIIEALETDIIPVVSQMIDSNSAVPQTLSHGQKTYQLKRMNTESGKNNVTLVFEDFAQ